MTKLLLSTALASSLAFSNAVLPPGYQDEMWCPPDDCKIYSNPFGYDAGPLSSFYFCYTNSTNSTGNVTDGVWTGNLTNVTAPEGWEEPEECTSEVYSECDYDEDCIPTVRTAGPTDELWGLCTCFADSIYHPFDQCEGRNETYCAEGYCTGDPCKNYFAECVKQEDTGAGACIIEWNTLKPSRRPTRRPTRRPSRRPSSKPSKKPTKKPSNKDTDIPTVMPTEFPSPFPQTAAPNPYFPPGGQCGNKCKVDSDCQKGGFNPCGSCGQLAGTIMYQRCFAPDEFPSPSPLEPSNVPSYEPSFASPTVSPSSPPSIALSTAAPSIEPITPPPSSDEPVSPAPSPVQPLVTPVPTIDEAPGTEAPVHMSLPMEDMFDKDKKRVFVRGSKTPPNPNTEYYDGGFVEEEEPEFGRYSGVKAIA